MAVHLLPVANNPPNANSKKNYPATPIASTITNGFFMVDNKWTVKYWNKAAEKILKVPAEDIIGTNLLKKFAGILPADLYAITSIKEVPLHFHEYWNEAGAWFDVITYNCDSTLAVSFKISNRPQVKAADNPIHRLKSLTELYRLVTEITNDCLWEWDLQAEGIFWIDGGHKRVFGYDVEDALVPEKFWESCIHPDDRERVLTGLRKMLTRGTSPLWQAEYRFKNAAGRYLYVQDRAHIIYDETGVAQRMIGATQDVTEKVQLENKLAQERLLKQRQITDAVLTAQEKERATIGTELNENIKQLLVATKWNIQIAKKDNDKRERCLENSSEYLDNVIEEIRRIYKTIIIPDINITSLSDNINNLIQELNKTHAIKLEFFKVGIDEEEDLEKNMQLDIFRMVQEQLNNIIKHAKASEATIKLHRQADKIILTISDNGNGCDTKTERSGVGIFNITSRAELYGGTVNIASEPGEGFRLTIDFPLCAHSKKKP